MNATAYQNCRLCPRACGVDRAAGQRGYCGETAVCRIASAAPHFGEEPSFTGTRGSGTVFFSGCSCRCFFCQNHQISRNETDTGEE
jgi:putative pyruvate formate lyase activating enzyme